MQSKRKYHQYSLGTIARLIKEYPGRTCAELSVDSGTLADTLSEALCHTCQAVQGIRKGKPGICTANGRLSETWFPV